MDRSNAKACEVFDAQFLAVLCASACELTALPIALILDQQFTQEKR